MVSGDKVACTVGKKMYGHIFKRIVSNSYALYTENIPRHHTNDQTRLHGESHLASNKGVTSSEDGESKHTWKLPEKKET
jgi:hypothetical protein